MQAMAIVSRLVDDIVSVLKNRERRDGPNSLRLGFEYRDYQPIGHSGWSNPSAVLENEHYPSIREIERAVPKARRKLRENGREENCDPGTEVGSGRANSPGIRTRRVARVRRTAR